MGTKAGAPEAIVGNLGPRFTARLQLRITAEDITWADPANKAWRGCTAAFVRAPRRAVRESEDVLLCRLIQGKITFVDPSPSLTVAGVRSIDGRAYGQVLIRL